MSVGSSPRVRGTRRGCAAAPGVDRFIPACAGNARHAPRARPGRPVHPRVCGERSAAHLRLARVTGSSPRVRGTRARRPAHHDRRSVHPRVCGERVVSSSAAPALSGSSPRVRGTPVLQLAQAFQVRFIPACAGNAVDLRIKHIPAAVHPRVCGERSRSSSFSASAGGSSPRVRGTQDPSGEYPGPVRFIPACAGNACRW